ncbi:hypothetical protein L596_005834 [Steinernema carpocapsae]|uniref:Uncharacterized protein n=1 Tax=Steinernema carpocapsae TaxID=34508 RepID=A0A4U8V0A0_STECR|nr:hypothetical protein L596_005834 [Steinernema carpocapsae]
MWDTISIAESDGCGCCYRPSGVPRRSKPPPYPGPSPASSHDAYRLIDSNANPRSPFFLMPYALDDTFNGIEKPPSGKSKRSKEKSLYSQDKHAPSRVHYTSALYGAAARNGYYYSYGFSVTSTGHKPPKTIFIYALSTFKNLKLIPIPQ